MTLSIHGLLFPFLLMAALFQGCSGTGFLKEDFGQMGRSSGGPFQSLNLASLFLAEEGENLAETLSVEVPPTYPLTSICPIREIIDTSNTIRVNYDVESIRESEESSAELYIFGMHRTTGVATRSFETQQVEMPVRIPDGPRNIHLVLFAYKPTRWKVLGAKERVRSIEVIGFHCQELEDDLGPGTRVSIRSFERDQYPLFSSQSFQDLDESTLYDMIEVVSLRYEIPITKAQFTFESLHLEEFLALP